jgi:hypothetical protein
MERYAPTAKVTQKRENFEIVEEMMILRERLALFGILKKINGFSSRILCLFREIKPVGFLTCILSFGSTI